MFADYGADKGLIALIAQSGFAGMMIDTARKTGGRLFDHMDIAEIGHFVDAARAHGLVAGLAGSLEVPDIPRLSYGLITDSIRMIVSDRLEVHIKEKSYRAASGSRLRVLGEFSMAVANGEFAAIVGPSGCGNPSDAPCAAKTVNLTI